MKKSKLVKKKPVVVDDEGHIELTELRDAIPANLRRSITQETVDEINSIMTDDEMKFSFRDNVIGFSSVLKDGKFKLVSYFNAVRYVSYRLNGNSTVEAWRKTFPDRYDTLIDKGTKDKTISAYASNYNGTLLVQKLFEQTITPSSVLFKDVFFEAIQTEVDLMRTSQSDKVRQDAAATLIQHLKPPEKQELAVTVEDKTEKVISSLSQATQELVEERKRLLQSGMSLSDIGAMKSPIKSSNND
ncbi:MAG: hypothetical protein Tp152SUR00d2C52646391_79 [Prokaryotic dsDNA virus sp.]|nr:MAG: hypothetical protein Tp152SUR00d2C52646391_79 [Prokaryotic dsDNA virus sp.]|tara:strand:+ start:4480 stop:5211 length:732 start_codon:yes stop_codon:yes gene_type:complete